MDFIINLLIWTVLIIVVPALVISAFIMIKTHRQLKKSETNRNTTPITHRYEYETLYLFDSGAENKFFNFYKDELEENDEYNLTAKELKEDYMDEKVWKYAPYDLPFRTEGDEVYSVLNDEWVRIGKIKSRDVSKLEEGEVTLALYPKIYKYVTEEGIQRESDTPYFALTVKRKIELGTVTKN